MGVSPCRCTTPQGVPHSRPNPTPQVARDLAQPLDESLPGLSAQGREVFDWVCLSTCVPHANDRKPRGRVCREPSLGPLWQPDCILEQGRARLVPEAQVKQTKKKCATAEPGCSWFLVYFSRFSTWPCLKQHDLSVKFGLPRSGLLFVSERSTTAQDRSFL